MIKAGKLTPVLLVLILALAIVSCPPKRPVESASVSPRPTQQDKLETARSALNSGNYDVARSEAWKFIEGNPSSPLCADAQYVIALSYLREGREDDARKELDRLLKNFPHSSNSVDAAATLRALEAKRIEEIAAIRAERERAARQKARVIEDAMRDMQIAAAKGRVYVVLDLLHDVVMLKMGTATLYAFPCATGKGRGYLPTTGKLRIFATPIGKFYVKIKRKNPQWVRPNWYWLERGEEVPEGMTGEERMVPNALGKYSIGIGNAIFFHGHPGLVKPGKYTHGCIRLNADHLEIMYNLVEVGTEVYIF